VDDDSRNIFAMCAVFKSKGIKHLIAKDGEEALRMLEENPEIDTVLMDMMMPKMDGFEATRRIRGIEKYRDLPVIALTARAMKGDREKCFEAGVTGYVSKPVSIEELFRELGMQLD